MSLSKPASDRVLFNEDYLSMIFPYLSTADLKSVRLVTPFWNKIGTKFLGRKPLKPLRFSDLNHKDWLFLKKEIEGPQPEEDPRIKLFQRFELTWLDLILNLNLITPFKPSQIVIKGKDANPGYTLTSFLTPFLNTLTDVTLKIYRDVLIEDFTFMSNFAQLQGMRLKVLCLEIFQDKLWNMDRRFYGSDLRISVVQDPQVDHRDSRSTSAPPLINILRNIFVSQAPTLEELDLKIECNGKLVLRDIRGVEVDSKIQLPIFPRLTSLTLALSLLAKPYQDPLNNFQQFNFSEKFPKLNHLHLKLMEPQLLNIAFAMIDEGINNVDLGQREGDTLELTRDHPLTKLNIDFPKHFFKIPLNGYFYKLWISFPFVKEFTAKGLRTDGAEIPWVDTLRKLDISGSFSTFNLVHLKSIETLHYTLEYGKDVEDVNGLINMFLRHCRELAHLKKFHISGYKITVEQFNQIQEALPHQFREILTIDMADED